MLRESDLAQSPAESLQDVAPPEPELAETQLSAEGEVPQVSADGATTEVGQTASEQAFGDKPTAQTGQLDGGMFEPEEYQAACIAAGTPEKWDDKYARGHTQALGWTQPYDGRYDNAFELERGHSASQAVKDFLAGPTITDFRTIGVAVEMDELRDELGDQQFDFMFGTADGVRDSQISHAQRLKITTGMYTIPFAEQMMAMANSEFAVAETDEPEAPAVEARVEEKPQEAGISAPAPEMIAQEMGVQREQELV
jgi:hypothetical protein